MKMSIRVKITIMILILTLTTTTTIGFIVYKNAKELLVNDIKTKNQSTLDNIYDYFLKNFMDSMEYVVTYWAENEEIVNYRNQPNQAKMVTTIPAHFEPVAEQWNGFMVANPDTAWIYLGVEEDGSIFITPLDPTMPQDYDCRERDWYKSTVERDGQVIWTEPYLDAGDSGEIIVTVAKAVKNEEKLVGVVGMDIKLGKFSEIIKSLVFGESGYLMLVSSTGDVYAHPDETMLMTNIAKEQWFEKALSDNRGTDLYRAPGGKETIVSYLSVPETDWKLVGVTQANIDDMIIPIRNRVLVMALISLIVTLVLGNILSLVVTKPVEEIMGVIHKISNGQMDVRADIQSRDEFKILGEKFNEMLEEIQSLLEERNLHVEELMEKNMEIKEQNDEILAFSEETEAMNEELSSLLDEIRKNYLSTVRALANSIEAKDKYTRGHCERVRDISMTIGKHMGLGHLEMHDLEFASILHDIGKIGIPSEILNKEGKLTEEEYEIIKSHPQIAYDILSDVEFLGTSREVIYEHHERVDGLGYPRRLMEDQISLSGKILSVADAYDAMTSVRPYRKEPLTTAEAIHQLQAGKGVQFDAEVVDVFVDFLRQEENSYQVDLEIC